MPKPVLSDSLFNADDVATAILQQANLSVTNQDFAVTDQTSLFVTDSAWTPRTGNQAYSFNGFMFLSGVWSTSSTPSNGDNVFTISDSDYYPIKDSYFNSISYQGDNLWALIINSSGEGYIQDAQNNSASLFYVNINGYYRFT
jgi:hypothetical protein